MIESVLCPNPGRGKIEQEQEPEQLGLALLVLLELQLCITERGGCLLSPVGSYGSCGFWLLLMTPDTELPGDWSASK